MADQLTDALVLFVEACPHVVSTRDLVTKVRVELEQNYILELFFRETTGQYSYTVLLGNRRVLGWDNARHHPTLPNAPHHFHDEDRTVAGSNLTGDPVQDIRVVAERVNALFAEQHNDSSTENP